MRNLLIEIEPNLEQVIAWKAPMFKLDGKYVAGLCSFKKHLTFSPQSADVMTTLQADLADFVCSQNSFQFGVDQVLPKSLVTKLVTERIKEIRANG